MKWQVIFKIIAYLMWYCALHPARRQNLSDISFWQMVHRNTRWCSQGDERGGGKRTRSCNTCSLMQTWCALAPRQSHLLHHILIRSYSHPTHDWPFQLSLFWFNSFRTAHCQPLFGQPEGAHPPQPCRRVCGNQPHGCLAGKEPARLALINFYLVSCEAFRPRVTSQGGWGGWDWIREDHGNGSGWGMVKGWR